MKVVSDDHQLQKISRKLSKDNKTIGFIPTMGALHQGHLKLVRESKAKNDITIVSIFVNPAQFSPNEDLKKYPRPFKNDQDLLVKEGIDYLFHPNVEEMYPKGFQTYVSVNNLSNVLEGKIRPGHFTGVATVVLKLFNLIEPNNTYFGQKDFQQCAVIKQMIKDLNLSININVVPTERDKDGLALSSRNIFLNKQERLQAPAIYQSLLLAKKLISNNNTNVKFIKKQMIDILQKYRLIRLDYIEICDSEDLLPIKVISNTAVILIAAYLGKTRLIDNITT